MKKVKVGFVDFWEGFDAAGSFFVEAMRRFCVPVLDDQEPDFLFYSDGAAKRHRTFDCKKIYFSIENKIPNFRRCDYAFTFKNLKDKRNFRLPFYIFANADKEKLIKSVNESPEQILAEKHGFCSALISNKNPRRTRSRIELFNAINDYKEVASGGRFKNNQGGLVKDKQAFISQYKFSIASENRVSPGYVTEKLPEAMAARTLPIYRGPVEVSDDFNPKSFIHVNRFSSLRKAVDHIIKVDNDDDLYLEYMRQPYFVDNKLNKYYSVDTIVPHLKLIFKDTKRERSLFYFSDIIADLKVRWHLESS